MKDFSQSIPKHIRKLVESSQDKPLKQSQGLAKPIALNLNENPFGPSPLALQALEAAIRDAHRYPEIDAVALQSEIAAFHDVSPAQVLVTPGATEFLCIIARILLGASLKAITSACSFIVYKLATQVTEGELIEVPMRNLAYDLDGIANAIDPDTRIIFIANPNNPTGSIATADEIDRFLEKIPERVLVVLDEAYGDFAAHFARQRGFDYSHAVEHIRAGRNLILLKTFSKAHGLAGLRVGYGIAPARLISVFAQARSVFSISSAAQAAAIAALRDENHIQRAVQNNSTQAEMLSRQLKDLGYPVPLTWANFVFCELEADAALFAERLLSQGIMVQPLGTWGAPNAIRVSIGTPEQNEAFLRGLKTVFGKG